MFSDIHFLSQGCSKVMKLIHKIKFSVQMYFLVCGCLTVKSESSTGLNMTGQ
jgi:hypothetical protein